MDAVIDYLLQGDPAIRWQVLRDLTDAAPDEVAAERARVATEGWGARLLAAQGDDGLWDGGTYRPGWVDESLPFFDAWTATHFSLQSLWEFGLDPAGAQAQRAVALVRENVRWEHDGEPYFAGEVEPCINGIALGIGAYFGEQVDPIVETIVAGSLADGGWNCWADGGAAVSSFHSTICVLEGLREWEAATGGTDASRAARAAGEEYLLERGLYRRRSTGEPADPRMLMLSYPVRWFHDILRGLEHFRAADRRDERLADAVEILRGKADAHGMFRYENHHEGPRPFEMEQEGEGFPSRWVTLRALRVLRWWDAAA
ncbi:hypothetical protein [Microbacterium terricola]|uniref:Squalene cyclase n=1 Tax=Microbacterium terricola TaxID=344163 RepID=A0ABM8DX87_9MICO|nr:hypothetical protein [Microbacterium terricola]UYK39175.1 hypothetical protein OAU46_10760 [Microbacterium terricola]BDV30106.1 hypothetical protein Microterr_07660 [Microbacterium terricola]